MVKESYLRNLVFGFEDGFVSTVGTVVGVAATAPPRSFVIVTGLVVIAVEAFSMGVGSYLTEKSAHELGGSNGRDTDSHKDSLFLDSLIMWASYFLAGMVVLGPYFLLESVQMAIMYSVSFTLIGLFLLGFIKGRIVERNPIKSGIEMLTVAGLAMVIGFGVGELGQQILSNKLTD